MDAIIPARPLRLERHNVFSLLARYVMLYSAIRLNHSLFTNIRRKQEAMRIVCQYIFALFLR